MCLTSWTNFHRRPISALWSVCPHKPLSWKEHLPSSSLTINYLWRHCFTGWCCRVVTTPLNRSPFSLAKSWCVRKPGASNSWKKRKQQLQQCFRRPQVPPRLWSSLKKKRWVRAVGQVQVVVRWKLVLPPQYHLVSLHLILDLKLRWKHTSKMASIDNKHIWTWQIRVHAIMGVNLGKWKNLNEKLRDSLAFRKPVKVIHLTWKLFKTYKNLWKTNHWSSNATLWKMKITKHLKWTWTQCIEKPSSSYFNTCKKRASTSNGIATWSKSMTASQTTAAHAKGQERSKKAFQT